VGAGEIDLDGTTPADLPWLNGVQGLADQLGAFVDFAEIAQAASKVRGEPGLGIETQPRRLVARTRALIVAFGFRNGNAPLSPAPPSPPMPRPPVFVLSLTAVHRGPLTVPWEVITTQ
jgi:hypothetical protein